MFSFTSSENEGQPSGLFGEEITRLSHQFHGCILFSDSLRNTFSAYQCFRFYLNKIHLMLSSIHEKTTLRNTIDI
ncbi:hypothetical protein PAPYR_11304 [Paratrimastix pyriformis]|uniref:Uncharacterized protein n=1 Tax=Paratrimastix pyriformis TaxID=342808 RepID=A0ABQ8U422_9EUKA|nr:hypothetical protein PAPYR_12141 [Paratrimastix pyriformis]KAJ4454083.1 hypothetical protein PAPYR_11302 [Paratrimastix pyriformis]KAJ4454085.1 hypothetical protein PAPYR_11304 [Paratrimastix pyriformis]